ncbi:MAG: DNA-binding response regulator [Lachnospiraceae bacterium]|nr:DNA-binding response regulator [Lachnospiraceae bacterium]
MKRRLMIIDDDMEVLSLMQNQLQVLYEVIVCSSGNEALACLKEETDTETLPELILLDIAMPGLDGYEVLRMLKADGRFKRIPVVFLTGITDEVAEIRGLGMDVVDYLKKPIAGKVLLARVQHYLELYSNADEKGKLDETKLSGLPEPLSDREIEVARLMGEFRSDREISEILYISMPYVKKLVAAVKEKLGLERRGDIRRYLV